MFNSQQHKQAGSSIFMSSMQGLANMLAVVTTFLGTGPLYASTKDWIFQFSEVQYGADIAEFASTICWFPICAATLFFCARASISTAIMFGAVALISRFV
jgi:hypothetical protein